MKVPFPFTAITAQDDFKLCLILSMIDQSIGGVLAMGDKGTGKTTTVRGLSALMKKVNQEFSFVNLPIGATEDRVLGTVELETLINHKKTIVKKGLLAEANQGILYIDEVNLLNDYLMDVLLDASASGGYYLERDNISQWLESKFSLVGTMNPEEGELRPQLLDRFGLSVVIKTPQDKQLRTEIMKRRMEFDSHPAAFIAKHAHHESTLAQQIINARKELEAVLVPDLIYEEIADICLQYKVEGLRADILLVKAARCYAAFNHKQEVTKEDVHTVLPFVLNHRSKSFSHQNPPRKSNDKDSSGEEKEGDTRRFSRI